MEAEEEYKDGGNRGNWGVMRRDEIEWAAYIHRGGRYVGRDARVKYRKES